MPQDQKPTARHSADKLARLREENMLLRENILLREQIARAEASKTQYNWGVFIFALVLISLAFLGICVTWVVLVAML